MLTHYILFTRTCPLVIRNQFMHMFQRLLKRYETKVKQQKEKTMANLTTNSRKNQRASEKRTTESTVQALQP